MFENAFWLAAASWRQGKEAIEQSIAVDNVAIHALAGVLLFVGIASVMPRRGNWLFAWLMVLGIAIWNEVVDIATERWPDINEQYFEAALDLWATLAFPTTALLIAIVCDRFVDARNQDAREAAGRPSR